MPTTRRKIKITRAMTTPTMARSSQTLLEGAVVAVTVAFAAAGVVVAEGDITVGIERGTD